MSKSLPKIAVISAILGGLDDPPTHPVQSIEHDYYLFTEENFPLRDKAMTPRLQAKIPKCFGWQLKPGYDYYMWIDGSLTMTSTDTLKHYFDAIQGYDLVVLKHPGRDTVYWESRYLERGLKDSRYINERYAGEWVKEQMAEIMGDKNYKDDLLVNGGVFIYRNIPQVQEMLKEWWYHISRYLIMDQCSWAYVIKKSGVKVNALEEAYNESPFLAHQRHRIHA